MMLIQKEKWLSAVRVRCVLGCALAFPLFVELGIKINELVRLIMNLPSSNQFALAHANGWTNPWISGLLISIVFALLPARWLNKICNYFK